LSDSGDELNPETAVTVGRIIAAHGVRGEVKVQSLTDFGQRFHRGSRLWLNGREVRVERSRAQGRNVVLKLSEVDDRTAAEKLRDAELMVPQPASLATEGVYYQHDILGLEVVEKDGTHLGRVTDILSTGSNDVYDVEGPRGEVLLPALDDVVLEIDLEAGRMVVELLPGLEFQAKGPSKARRRTAGPGRHRTSQSAP
jgi:16S rRNA processing protein RimM